ERIDMILTDLRRLARDLKSPVLVISSMNRGAYKKGKDGIRRPSMTSLKESGGIEYSADVVICLWKNREESKKLTGTFKPLTTDRIEALILKNRNGEQNKRVNMNFTKAWSRFEEEGRGADLEADEDE
ncbi:MAG: DnaB-like helicase C-terminal domain-containing protein, partial [Pseudorhodobacter sp.]|nr:DnaB-like helicase C-terminal domain-containing protein [Pseudorhodobacter sp.]